MAPISMEGCIPYRKMAAKTRPVIREKRIVWPRVEGEPFNGFQVKVLSRRLLPSSAELWRKGYPELYGSLHEFLFDPEMYEKFVALEETWEYDSTHKPICMPVLVELSTEKVVSAAVLTKREANLEVEYSLIATLPEYRRQRITIPLRRVVRQIANQSGAEYFTTFCETWHAITQKWCIKGGWKIAGIFPGAVLRWNGDNEQYRGCIVWFYRLNEEAEEHSTHPDEWQMAEEVREVWKAIERVNKKIRKKIGRSG